MELSLLDTDIFSEMTRGKNLSVLRRVDAYLSVFGHLSMSVMTISELVEGYQRKGRHLDISSLLKWLDAEAHEVIPLSADTAVLAGRIRGDLIQIGQSIGFADTFIAATAISFDYLLVTGNTRHFERIAALGYPLRLDDWRL